MIDASTETATSVAWPDSFVPFHSLCSHYVRAEKSIVAWPSAFSVPPNRISPISGGLFFFVKSVQGLIRGLCTKNQDNFSCLWTEVWNALPAPLKQTKRMVRHLVSLFSNQAISGLRHDCLFGRLPTITCAFQHHALHKMMQTSVMWCSVRSQTSNRALRQGLSRIFPLIKKYWLSPALCESAGTEQILIEWRLFGFFAGHP